MDAPANTATTASSGNTRYAVERRQAVTSANGFAAAALMEVPEDYLRLKLESTVPSLAFQAVAPTSRGHEIAPWLRRLSLLAELKFGWNDEDSPPPSPMALHNSRRVLELLFDYDICPARVAPSAEGGVVITFLNDARTGAIEVLNDGEMVAVTSDGSQMPEAWNVSGETGVRQTLARIASYLA